MNLETFENEDLLQEFVVLPELSHSYLATSRNIETSMIENEYKPIMKTSYLHNYDETNSFIDKLEIPTSSNDLTIPKDNVISLVEIYETIKNFSSILKLSLFRFEDLCYTLSGNEQTVLLSEIHVAFIRCILKNCDSSGVSFGPNEIKDSINILNYSLDFMTWFEVLKCYAESSLFATFNNLLPLLSKDNYFATSLEERIYILQALVDRLMLTEVVRNKIAQDGKFIHEDYCRFCQKLGDLICCETCPAVYHLECVNLSQVPDGDWMCSICTKQQIEGVFNCSPDGENSFMTRWDPLGHDRHGRIYWFFCRRIIVESENENWYYSSVFQLEQLMKCLDADLEEELLLKLGLLKEEIVRQMRITEQLTKRYKGNSFSALDKYEEVYQWLDKSIKSSSTCNGLIKNENLDEISDEISKYGSETKYKPVDNRTLPIQYTNVESVSLNGKSPITLSPSNCNIISTPLNGTTPLNISLKNNNLQRPKIVVNIISRKLNECLPKVLIPKNNSQDNANSFTITRKSDMELSYSKDFLDTSVNGNFPVKNLQLITLDQNKDNCFYNNKRSSLENQDGLFRLGLENMIYDNLYSVYTYAIDRNQQVEDKDRRRYLSYKFYLDFSWTGPTVGDSSILIGTIRASLLQLEAAILPMFLHCNWPQRRKRWVQLVNRADDVAAFSVAIRQLEVCIRPSLFCPAYRDALGFVRLKMIGNPEKEDPTKKDFQKKKCEQELEFGKYDNVKFTNPVLHQLWKHKGEEYRLIVGAGWIWVSINWHSVAMETDGMGGRCSSSHQTTATSSSYLDPETGLLMDKNGFLIQPNRQEVEVIQDEDFSISDNLLKPAYYVQLNMPNHCQLNKLLEFRSTQLEVELQQRNLLLNFLANFILEINSKVKQYENELEASLVDPNSGHLLSGENVTENVEENEEKLKDLKPYLNELLDIKITLDLTSEDPTLSLSPNILNCLDPFLIEGKIDLNITNVNDIQIHLENFDLTKNKYYLYKSKPLTKLANSDESVNEFVQKGKVPKMYNFNLRKLPSIFALDCKTARKMARRGGLWEVPGFGYHKANSVHWHCPGPRPLLRKIFQFKTQIATSLASICTQLRLLHASIRWEDMTARLPSVSSNIQVLESAVTSTQLCKSRFVPPDASRLEYLVKKVILQISCQKGFKKESYARHRSGLRERRSIEVSENDVSISETWVPEEQLTIGQLKLFNERTKSTKPNTENKIKETDCNLKDDKAVFSEIKYIQVKDVPLSLNYYSQENEFTLESLDILQKMITHALGQIKDADIQTQLLKMKIDDDDVGLITPTSFASKLKKLKLESLIVNDTPHDDVRKCEGDRSSSTALRKLEMKLARMSDFLKRDILLKKHLAEKKIRSDIKAEMLYRKTREKLKKIKMLSRYSSSSYYHSKKQSLQASYFDTDFIESKLQSKNKALREKYKKRNSDKTGEISVSNGTSSKIILMPQITPKSTPKKKMEPCRKNDESLLENKQLGLARSEIKQPRKRKLKEMLSKVGKENKEQEPANQEENEEDKLYCLCKTPYDNNKFYIGCDRCEDWFHGDCVGVCEGDADNLDTYVCPNCQTVERKSKQKKQEKDFLKEHHFPHLQKLLSSLQNHRSAWPFLEAVNKIEVPDYYEVIKKPMDLSTMESKLLSKSYKKLDEFTNDLFQIFENCRLYNQPETSFSRCADILETFFNEKFKVIKLKLI